MSTADRMGDSDLQNVEGGWIQEVERDEVQYPDHIMDTRHTTQVPQGRAAISVVDEIYQG